MDKKRLIKLGFMACFWLASVGVFSSSYATQKNAAEKDLIVKPVKSSPALKVSPVNINTADAQTLANGLKGIGLNKAKAIVDWRLKYGKFKAIDQLTEVKGIGEGIIKKNKDRLKI